MRLPAALVSVVPTEKKPLTPPRPNLGRAPGSCKPEARPPASGSRTVTIPRQGDRHSSLCRQGRNRSPHGRADETSDTAV
jgi:hypothetical protein